MVELGEHGAVLVAVLLAQLFDLGQGQHLVGDAGGAIHRVVDLGKGLGRGDIAALGRLHLDLEHGQRRAQLVRGVTHKAFLIAQQALQALHGLVGSLQQRLDFTRGLGCRQRAQISLGTALQVLAEPAYGLGGALHHDDDDQGDDQHQQGLTNQGVTQNLQGQGFAQFQGFGHLDHGHAASVGTGNRLQQHGYTHGVAAKLVVVEVHQRRIGRALRNPAVPDRQLLEARDQLSVQRGDAVEHAALVVSLENFQCRIGNDGAQLCLIVVSRDANLLADAFGRGQQGSVVSRVQRCQGLLIEAPGVEGNQRQHGQQNAGEQQAPQRPGCLGPRPGRTGCHAAASALTR